MNDLALSGRELAQLPIINIAAMIAYLEAHGWTCTPHGGWQGGYHCMSEGGFDSMGLPLAVKTQITRDLNAAFKRAGVGGVL